MSQRHGLVREKYSDGIFCGRRCFLVAIYTRSDRSELRSTYSFVVRSLKRREKRIEFESHSSVILKLDSYNGTDNPTFP